MILGCTQRWGASLAMAHFYPAPGPVGVSVHPGPNGNPHLLHTFCRDKLSSPPAGIAPNSLGNTRLARTQQHVHDQHADNMLKHHHRALTGGIYGHPPEMGMASATLRGSASRRTLSSPLMAAGASAAGRTMPVRTTD